MMYYKISNKKSKTYKKCHELRTEELKMEKENAKRVREIVGDDWDHFCGWSGQQNIDRVTWYNGFAFKDPSKLSNAWKKHKEYPDIYVPNTRTKAGKKIKEELNNLQRSCFYRVLEIFGLQVTGRFSYPYMEICDSGEIVLAMDDQFNFDNFPEVIEITKREAERLLKGGEE